MKKLLWPLFVFVFLSLACVLPGSAAQSDLESAVGERDALRTQTAAMQTEMDRLGEEMQQYVDLQAGLADKTAELEALQQEYDRLNLDFERISQAQVDAQTALDNANTQLTITTDEYVAVVDRYNFLLCNEADTPSFNFNQPDGFQQVLTNWILGWENKERIFLDADTDVIWNNSEARQITIRYEIPSEDTTVKQVFVAYFADDLVNDGVYWVNRACWLYEPY